jgi:Endonuclease/Exonuclease/phosphatase family
MRRLILATITTSLLGIAGAASAAPASSLEIQVMTQNQYIGADLFPLIPTVGTPLFDDAVRSVAATMSANRTADRVRALANEIAARNPHLVGLQEAWDVECIPANAAPCTNPEFANAWGDHLAITSQVLGTKYYVAAVVKNFETFIPLKDGAGNEGLVYVLDRDAILARSDVTAAAVKPSPTTYPCNGDTTAADDGCNYAAALPIGLLGNLPRGFVIVDATVGGNAYRFVNTHLENGFADGLPGVVQSAQAVELIGILGAITPNTTRLVIVGDMNSSPNDAVDPDSPIPATPYMLFAGAELFDVWQYRPGNVAGLSCCQAADLMNRASLLTRRIDLIFTREMPKIVKDARLVGEVAADRLGPPGRGLWPSDHAAVAAWWKN